MSRKPRLMIALGLTAVALAGACLYLYPNYLAPLALEGRRSGYDPPTYVTVVTLQHRAEEGKRLDDRDMRCLLQLSDDHNPFIRMKALSALQQTRGTKQAESGARIARKKLTDENPLVRSYALNALSRLMAPDTIQVARKMLNDADGSVRKEASRIVATTGK